MNTTFNNARITDIKNNLRELKIPFKSNLRKRDLYDLLAARQTPGQAFIINEENTAAVIKIQAVWRGRYTRQMLELRGNAAFNRQLCSNDIDPISLNPIEDLPMKLFFSYRADDGRYYGFDINSLKKCLDNSQLKNPFNREAFSSDTLYDIHACYASSTSSTDEANGKRERSERKINTRERAFEIFHNFHLSSGFFVDESWYLDLGRKDLINFYKRLFTIIRLRSPAAFHDMCNQANISGLKFFDLYDDICSRPIYNTPKMQQMILLELEAIVNIQRTQDDKVTAIIWVLIALTQSSHRAAIALPFLS
jgi:hypothetical protein